jgi:hypothetical protein
MLDEPNDETPFIYNESTNIINLETNKPLIIEKKRGRKPKNKSLIPNQITPIENIPNISNEPPIIKKRGRKVTNNKIINLISESNIDLMTNLIVHLPLKLIDINKIINGNDSDSIEYKPILPISKYVDFTEDIFHTNSTHNDNCPHCQNHLNHIIKLEEEISSLKNGIIFNSSNFNKKIYESKINFFNKLMDKYEEQTNIACWWCCHNFNNIPLGIPEYINKNEFNLSGCFCSFNCMMAYNIDLNDYKIWDRQSNIYQMKSKIDPENKISIHPAPPRQTLNMFGGPLDINKFRESFFIVSKEFRCFFPPMISIIGIIEEDNKNQTTNNYNRHQNQTMLRRNKPFANRTNKLVDIIKTN